MVRPSRRTDVGTEEGSGGRRKDLLKNELRHNMRSFTAKDEDGNLLPSFETHQDGFVSAEVTYHAFGNPNEVLHFYGYTDHPELPNRSSLLIKVEASTVSQIDCQMRRNTFTKTTPLPHSPGSDCVGTVYRCGDLADQYGIQPGDRVAALSPLLGGNSRYVSAYAHDVIKVPKDLDAVDAVCLLRSYVAAYQCLRRVGNRPIQQGDKVLVTGANGCVGRAVIELALLEGAGVVFATASRRHHEVLEGFGAVALGAEQDEWLHEVKGEMDLIIDTVGGETFAACREALRVGSGKLISVGQTSLTAEVGYFGMPVQSLTSLATASWSSGQTYVYDLFGERKEMPEDYAADLEYLFILLREGKIEPRIDDCIPLLAVADAHVRIEEGGLNGFIVCLPWKKASKLGPRMKSERPKKHKTSTGEMIAETCAQSGITNRIARFLVVKRRSMGHMSHGFAKFVTGDY